MRLQALYFIGALRIRRSRFRQERNHCRRITSGPPMLRQTTRPFSGAPRVMIGSLPDISRAAFGALPAARRAVASRGVRRTPFSGRLHNSRYM